MIISLDLLADSNFNKHVVYILVTALLLRILMDLCFKLSVQGVSFESQPLKSAMIILKSPALWAAIVMATVNFWLWAMVLSYYDLSFAYPLFSICFALIMISGRIFFNESLDAYKLVGIGCILASSAVLVLG
jgi:multidrug transporter EmrE-like cation transporter